MPGRYAGGVRLTPMRRDCGEGSRVDVEVIGDRRLAVGECGLCEGVEGRERDFVEEGENFEDCASAMVTSDLSLLELRSL